MSSIQNKQIRDRSTRPLQSQNGNAESHGSSKNQPTSEQLRIAQFSSDKSDVDPEMAKKIKEVSDLTGRSQDEAWTALHDCNGDTNQAVDLLFEKQDDSQVEWQEKKKKKKAAPMAGRAPTSDTAAFDTRQERTENEAERPENIPKGQPGRAPRFQRGRGRGNFSHNANGERDTSANCDRGSSERRFDGGRSSRRGGRGGGGAGRGRGGRGTNSTGFETVPHIDTWTNDTVQNGKNDTSFGAWQEVSEDWTADEWSGSLEESLVLTRSMATRSDVFSGMTDAGSSQHQAPQSQGYGSSSSRVTVGDGLTDGTVAAAGYRQQAMSQNVGEQASRSVGNFDINHLLPKFSEPYGMNRAEESAYLSHFNKEATECIKNAVGIGSSSLGSHGTGAGSTDQMGRQVPQSTSAQQVQLSNRMKQQQQQQQQQQQRSRLPPPSKIPASAVEMPGSAGNAQLDVQFGYLDMPSSSSMEVSSFLNDVSQSSQFTGPALNAQQPGSVNLAGNAKIAGMDTGIYQPGVPHSMNDSTSSTVLAMQEIAIGSKSAPYQQNTAQQKELGTSNKMIASSQILAFPSSSNEERKPMSSFSSQPSNQLPGQGSLSSQLGLSQLAYSSNVASAASSAYKASSAASGASAFSQPPNVSQHGLPGAGSLQHQGAQAMRTPHYPPGNPAANASYSYAVTEQGNFGGAASSYGVASTQAATAFGPLKPYGATDKQALPSGLPQFYETPAMGNAYPTRSQMTYQPGGVMYLSNQPGLSQDGVPSTGGGSGAYQNPGSLYRAGQATVNAGDFQPGFGESFPRGAQVVGTAQQQSNSGKLIEGLNKMAAKDSVVAQQYDSPAATVSSLTSASANALSSTSGLALTSAGASSSLRTASVATTKSTTVAGKSAVNWPSGLPPPMMNLNPNYVIGQPPGFQVATFGYPTAQQTVPYSYEDIQILQHRYALQPTAYYDMQIPAATTLPTRDHQSSLSTASYVAGSDVKLTTPVEPAVSVAIQPTHQPAAAATALHGYSYYYPGAPGILPMQSYYTPMIPMSGMAVPMVTNPSHGATTTSAQYQKPAMYGSHGFGPGGLSQDFSKTFNQQASVKTPGTTTGVVQNEVVGPGNAFGKSHVQGFDKAGFHSGTPPPTSFGLALASGSQEGALGQPAVYGAPYMPMMPHQSHSQVHHTVAAQDSSIVGRGVPQQNAVQGKIGPNKNNYSAPYWAPGN